MRDTPATPDVPQWDVPRDVREAQRLANAFAAEADDTRAALLAREFLVHYDEKVVRTRRHLEVAQRFDVQDPEWAWPAQYGEGRKGRTAYLKFLYSSISDVVSDMQEFLHEYADAYVPLREPKEREFTKSFKLGEVAKKGSL